MQAYYEIETDIPVNHQLHIQLPDTIPTGRAKIAVIYEVANLGNNEPQLSENPKILLDFLGAGKAHGRFSSAAEIDAFVADNRKTLNADLKINRLAYDDKLGAKP